MIHPRDRSIYLKEHLNFINTYPQEVGSKIFELEESCKDFFGVPFASACSSGSSALLLCLQALGIKAGDEVMLNCNYFISDPNAVLLVGAIPLFIDLGDQINSLSLDDIKKKMTPKTKAIILIHLYGYPLENTNDIIKECHKSGVFVIEDCCQSIGAKIDHKYVGTLGDFGVFSFDSKKMVKGGEGGMIISENKDWIDKTRLYKNNCKSDGIFLALGFNYRYNDFSALYAKYSLKNLPLTIETKRLASKEIQNVYAGGEHVSPSYYNFIIQRDSQFQHEKSDYLNLDFNKFPNLNTHMKKYEII